MTTVLLYTILLLMQDITIFTTLIPLCTLIILTGIIFNKIYRNVLQKYKKFQEPSIKQLTIRIALPTVINVLVYQISFMGPLLIYHLSHKYIFILFVYTTITYNLWTLTKSFPQLVQCKIDIQKANKKLLQLTQEYIINNSCYQKQCKLCKSTDKLDTITRENSSLLFKNFIPMWKANRKRISHIVTYEFKQGIYQLHGKNGIGKTTFLESISLPQQVWVEYSKGLASLCGEPLFNQKLTLYNHRKLFKYISAKTLQDRLSDINIKYFSKYKILYHFLQTAIKEKHKIQSEGEKGIISIVSITNMPQLKVLIVDEILSRIYQDPTYKLRDDVIAFIKDQTKQRKLITIIVDHMTKLKFAKQIAFIKRDDIYYLE